MRRIVLCFFPPSLSFCLLSSFCSLSTFRADGETYSTFPLYISRGCLTGRSIPNIRAGGGATLGAGAGATLGAGAGATSGAGGGATSGAGGGATSGAGGEATVSYELYIL